MISKPNRSSMPSHPPAGREIAALGYRLTRDDGASLKEKERANDTSTSMG